MTMLLTPSPRMQWELSIFLKLITLEMSFFKIRKFIQRMKISFCSLGFGTQETSAGKVRESLDPDGSKHSKRWVPSTSSRLQHRLCYYSQH